jgi:hypothetical protein
VSQRTRELERMLDLALAPPEQDRLAQASGSH